MSLPGSFFRPRAGNLLTTGPNLVDRLINDVNLKVDTMPFKEAVKGALGRILFWGATQDEADAAENNCPKITEKERNKLPNLFATFAETGRMPRSKEKFKSVENQPDLFAFKSHQVRLLGTFLDKVTFGICHCVRKKNDKYKKGDLDKAQQRKNEMKKEYERGNF